MATITIVKEKDIPEEKVRELRRSLSSGQKNLSYLAENYPKLLEEHPEQYAIICEGNLLEVKKTHGMARKVAKKMFSDEWSSVCLIEHITAGPNVTFL